MIEGRVFYHKRRIESISVSPAFDCRRVTEAGVGIVQQPLVTIQLATIVNEDAQSRSIVNQEPAKEHLVENRCARAVFCLVVTKRGQQVYRPVSRIEPRPAR